jgi:16S rRNA (cytosine1402-N4)-methyltransferase
LVQLIIDATPRAVQRAGHPAKRVFQALRIEVNAELAALEAALPAALDALSVGGRIVVLAYQSLEDRIVKRELARRTQSTAPAGLPIELPEHRPEFSLLVRGAELADDGERERNPRAIPVRLRAAERLRDVA